MYDPDDEDLFLDGWLNGGHDVYRDGEDGAFGTMATIAPMPWTMKRLRWTTGTRIDGFAERSTSGVGCQDLRVERIANRERNGDSTETGVVKPCHAGIVR